MGWTRSDEGKEVIKKHKKAHASHTKNWPDLTERRRKVLELTLAGKLLCEIAKAMNISTETVKADQDYNTEAIKAHYESVQKDWSKEVAEVVGRELAESEARTARAKAMEKRKGMAGVKAIHAQKEEGTFRNETRLKFGQAPLLEQKVRITLDDIRDEDRLSPAERGRLFREIAAKAEEESCPKPSES